jgi:hypothetical protein
VESLVGSRAVVSGDGHFSFVDMRAFADMQRTRLGSDRSAAVRQATLHPVVVRYRDGFGAVEADIADTWRWTESHARVELYNPDRVARAATITIPVVTGTPGEFHLDVIPPDAPKQRHVIGQQRSLVRIHVVVPPGTSSLRLATDAAPPPLGPTEPVNTGRIRVFPIDVTTDALEQALAGR